MKMRCESKMPTVGDVMTRGVISIDETSSIEEAMKTMVERHVTALVVKKAHEADVYGIITRKDVVGKIIAEGEDPGKLKVADLMTKPVMTIPKQMNIIAAAKLMEKTNVRRFPITDKDEIVGIVSNSDIFKAFVLDNLMDKKRK